MIKTIVAVTSILLFFSCGKNKSEEKEPGLLDLIENVSDLNKIADEVQQIEEDGSQLEKSTPISNELLRAIIPESLPEYSRKKIAIGNQLIPDISMAEAKYENENGDRIHFSIMDGAGETGSAMIAFARMGFSRDFEEETDTGYKKSSTINGYKGVEEVINNDYDNTTDTKIELLISKRFLITLEGNRLSVDKLKDFLDEFDLKELEKLAK
ncbi:hypothetical protein ABW636_05760 [Aquimarina sp. 2201CG1-2-11]|uniref:hypothetical protein n=1 Tax=Aquimarina discodermiae TaxID=3231043 RepID=UPI003462E7C6